MSYFLNKEKSEKLRIYVKKNIGKFLSKKKYLKFPRFNCVLLQRLLLSFFCLSFFVFYLFFFLLYWKCHSSWFYFIYFIFFKWIHGQKKLLRERVLQCERGEYIYPTGKKKEKLHNKQKPLNLLPIFKACGQIRLKQN